MYHFINDVSFKAHNHILAVLNKISLNSIWKNGLFFCSRTKSKLIRHEQEKFKCNF